MWEVGWNRFGVVKGLKRGFIIVMVWGGRDGRGICGGYRGEMRMVSI